MFWRIGLRVFKQGLHSIQVHHVEIVEVFTCYTQFKQPILSSMILQLLCL